MKKKIAVSIDEDLLAFLDRQGTNRSAVVEAALRQLQKIRLQEQAEAFYKAHPHYESEWLEEVDIEI